MINTENKKNTKFCFFHSAEFRVFLFSAIFPLFCFFPSGPGKLAKHSLDQHVAYPYWFS